jgi:hypothetical protein
MVNVMCARASLLSLLHIRLQHSRIRYFCSSCPGLGVLTEGGFYIVNVGIYIIFF